MPLLRKKEQSSHNRYEIPSDVMPANLEECKELENHKIGRAEFLSSDELLDKYSSGIDFLSSSNNKDYTDALNTNEKKHIDKKIIDMGEKLGFGDEVDKKRNIVTNIFRKMFGKEEKRTKEEIIKDKMEKIRDEAESWVKRDLFYKKENTEDVEKGAIKRALKTGKALAGKIGGLGKTMVETVMAFQGSLAAIGGLHSITGVAALAGGSGAVASFALAGGALYGGRKLTHWLGEKYEEHKYMKEELDRSDDEIQEKLKLYTASLISAELMDKSDSERLRQDKKYEKMREKFITGKIGEKNWKGFLSERSKEKVELNNKGIEKKEQEGKYSKEEMKDMGIAMGALGKMSEDLDGKTERKLYEIAKTNPKLMAKLKNEGVFKKMSKEYLNELKGLALFQIPVVRLALTGAGGWQEANNILDTAFDGCKWYDNNKYHLRILVKTVGGIGGAVALSLLFAPSREGSKIEGWREEFKSDWGKLSGVFKPAIAEAAKIKNIGHEVEAISPVSNKGIEIVMPKEIELKIEKGDSLWKISENFQKQISSNLNELGYEVAPQKQGVNHGEFAKAKEIIEVDAIKDFLSAKYKDQYKGHNPDVIQPGEKIKISMKELVESFKERGIIEQINELTPEQIKNVTKPKAAKTSARTKQRVIKKDVKAIERPLQEINPKSASKLDFNNLDIAGMEELEPGRIKMLAKENNNLEIIYSDANGFEKVGGYNVKPNALNEYLDVLQKVENPKNEDPFKWGNFLEYIKNKEIKKIVKTAKEINKDINLEYDLYKQKLGKKFKIKLEEWGLEEVFDRKVSEIYGKKDGKPTLEDKAGFLFLKQEEPKVVSEIVNIMEQKLAVVEMFKLTPAEVKNLSMENYNGRNILFPQKADYAIEFYNDNKNIRMFREGVGVKEEICINNENIVNSFKDWKKRTFESGEKTDFWKTFVDYVKTRDIVSKENMELISTSKHIDLMRDLKNDFGEELDVQGANKKIENVLKLFNKNKDLPYADRKKVAIMALDPHHYTAKAMKSLKVFDDIKNLKFKESNDKIEFKGLYRKGKEISSLYLDLKKGEFFLKKFFGKKYFSSIGDLVRHFSKK